MLPINSTDFLRLLFFLSPLPLFFCPALYDHQSTTIHHTSVGTFGGSLKHLTPTQLAVHSSKGALESANIDPSIIDTVAVGNVQQTSDDTIYLSRHVGLQTGVNVETPCLTVNRLCGSGFQAVATVAQDIMMGKASVGLAAGAESMSQAPFVVRDARWGLALGKDQPMKDSLWEGLTDKGIGLPMAITAENLAEQYDISKDDCDHYALRSQQTWKNAHEAGTFKSEITPIEVKGKRGKVSTLDHDEHARPDANFEAINKLSAIFKKGGTVSAGNASGISDGAASLILASEEAVQEHGLKPLARLVDWDSQGVDPTIMGIGPVPAIRNLLKNSGMTLDQIDRIEINEAFAAQFLACEKELGLDRDKCNVNGGAIAMGHPTGASGARIMGHLCHQMNEDKSLKYTVGAACIGGGQGIAMLLESV
jgi:acetyl-CoA acyltransferase 2